VCEGEIFGFVGPNGAGKTTLLKVLMGLIRATAGEATILGCDVHETEFRRHIGFLPENPYFYDYLTGREILTFYAKLSGLPRAQRADRVALLLGWVGLSSAANARLRTYSKGMLQRVGIAQALVHDPSVVFLDEPMSGLDPIGRKEIRDLILRLRAEGKTVFMNTHILSDVEMVCDEVVILNEGHIVHHADLEAERRANRRFVELEVTGDDGGLGAALQSRGVEGVSEGSGRWRIVLPTDVELDVIWQLVAQEDLLVHHLSHRRDSLEEIFLKAVGHIESAPLDSGVSAEEAVADGRL